MARGPSAPTTEEFEDIARHLGLRLDSQDIEVYKELASGTINICRRIDELTSDVKPRVKYPRTSGFKPDPTDNPFNAWSHRAEIKGADSGPLAGVEFAVKDAICVAGIPAMNGSPVLEGFVPDVDATVVERLLDAGAVFKGKVNCEDLCFAGHSQTCWNGPVKNPHKPTHSTGGSSSGSAAVIAAGDVPMALGGDQGGSIRIPSAWSGVYGLKPSYGLLPYTGAMMIDMTLDHLGPMADSTEKLALMLGAMAGPDGLDPRQNQLPADYDQDYTPALGSGVKGLKIGVIKQGFDQKASDWPETAYGESDPVVDKKVRAAIRRLEDLGATATEVDMPIHFDAGTIFFAIILQGAADFMLKASGGGSNWSGFYNVGLIEAFGHGMKARADDLSFTVKSVMLAGEYMSRKYQGVYHAKAQNLRGLVNNAYEDLLQSYDVLAMPTVPFRATPITSPSDPILEQAGFVHAMLGNTCQVNMTGHPAINIPCGMADELPIGLMVIGRRYRDMDVLRVSDAFESVGDWKDM